MIKKYLKKIYIYISRRKNSNYWWAEIETKSKFQKIHKNSETVINENNKEMPKEIPKERYLSPEERQKIIDNLRSIRIV